MTNLRVLYTPATPTTARDYAEKARLRARVLVIGCFATQEEAARFLRVPLRTVSRWLNTGHHLPAWVLIALELKARELGVEIARAA